MSQHQAKGTSIIPGMIFVKNQYGEAGWARVLERVTPQARAALSQKVLPITWYPLEVLTSMFDVIVEQYGNGDPKFGHLVGKMSADYGLTLIHKLVFKLRSPGLLASQGPDVWRQYYQPSTIAVMENVPGFISLELRGLESTPAHLQSIAGWMERVAELTGGRNARAEFDPATMRFNISYD